MKNFFPYQMNLKKFKIFILFGFMLLGQKNLFAQKVEPVNIITKLIEGYKAELKNKFQKGTIINLSSAFLTEAVQKKGFSAFHLNLGDNKEWDIDLQPSNITAVDYKLKIQTEEGIQTIPSHPDFLYKGKVR